MDKDYVHEKATDSKACSDTDLGEDLFHYVKFCHKENRDLSSKTEWYILTLVEKKNWTSAFSALRYLSITWKNGKRMHHFKAVLKWQCTTNVAAYISSSAHNWVGKSSIRKTVSQRSNRGSPADSHQHDLNGDLKEETGHACGKCVAWRFKRWRSG